MISARGSLMARTVLLVAVLAALFGAVRAAAETAADGRTGGGVGYAAAKTCCAGCSYAGGCCCAARDKLPLTSTKIRYIKTRTLTQKKVSTVTRTLYKTVTKTLKKRDLEAVGAIEVALNAERFARIGSAEHRFVKRELEPVESFDELEVAEIADPLDLFPRAAGRHLCSVCPKGVKLSGKTSGGSIKYCCPPRKTVFKTVKKTSTKVVATSTKVIRKTATKTLTVRKLAVKIFQDVDKNGKYNKPPDVPLTAGTKLALSNKSKRRLLPRQLICNVIAEAISTPSGDADFAVPITDVAGGDVLEVFAYEDCVDPSGIPEPIAEIMVNEDGSFPVVPPALVEYQTTTTAEPEVTTEVPEQTSGGGAEETPTSDAPATTEGAVSTHAAATTEAVTSGGDAQTTTEPGTTTTATTETTTTRVYRTSRATATLTFELWNKTTLEGCSDQGSDEVRSTMSSDEGTWTLRFYNPGSVNTTPSAPTAKFFCNDERGIEVGIWPGQAVDTSLPASFSIEFTNTTDTQFTTGLLDGMVYQSGNYTSAQESTASGAALSFAMRDANGQVNAQAGIASPTSWLFGYANLMPVKIAYPDPCNASESFDVCTNMSDEATRKSFTWSIGGANVLPVYLY